MSIIQNPSDSCSRRLQKRIQIEMPWFTPKSASTIAMKAYLKNSTGQPGEFLSRGIKPGDKIALWSPNVPQWLFAMLGLINKSMVSTERQGISDERIL